MTNASPRTKARIAGVFLFLYALAGGVAYGYSDGLVVRGDAATTAKNILANEAGVRLAIAGNLLSAACYVVVAVFLYELFKPVDKTIARLATFFSLVSCAIGAFDSVFQMGALDVLKGGPWATAFDAAQLQAMASLLLRLNVRALDMGQIFFGFQWIAIGYLIMRSTFLPKIVGAFAAFSGLWYLTRLYPPLVGALLPYSLIVPAIGVMLLTVWLATAGVNAQRWQEMADISLRRAQNA